MEESFAQQLVGDQGHYEYKYEGQTYLIHYAKVKFPDNWMIVNVQSKAKLYKEFRYMQWMTISVMIVFSLLALLLSPKITKLLLHPLTRLRMLMKQVEHNDLSVRYDSPFNDELSQVGQRFNTMLDRIEDLLGEVMEVEAEKRFAEVKALQAQINPHFLYNTLNTIVWKSESGEHEQVREMIISLSLLFRLGLNNGNDITHLGKELEHVEQYLFIQKQCYGKLFSYTIICEDSKLQALPILKILLQPLVENSILHGFKDIQHKGLIEISIRAEDKHVGLTVSDNGVGFDAASLERSLQHEGIVTKGYALRNVYNRLKLYYGTEAQMKLSSEPYRLTTIALKIPLKMPKVEELPWEKGSE
ncbi:histidine kinase [Paenibacillus sp. HB172176]|uniref:sensor histidine kinase n=1 Tax=Paenibacillus sp. HB172176 TaxID=2493690 RepID=UPI00143C8528|nr:histidine kinase [Paenibacillus sp. HB172176]